MAGRVLLGQKLRKLRKDRGITQVAMAERLEISPSYLNLIEHNQRSLTPKLRGQLVEAFGLEFEALSGAREGRLRDELSEVLADPLFQDFTAARDGLNEAVATTPALCGAMAELYRRYRHVLEDNQSLSRRLSEDPYISDTSHQLLTMLTSVRSFAEILEDNTGLTEEKRQEFTGILVQEAERLTDLVKGLFAFIGDGGLGQATAAALPRDEVDEALQAQNNYFPGLEAAAERIAADLGPSGTGAPVALEAVARLLSAEHGIDLERVPAAELATHQWGEPAPASDEPSQGLDGETPAPSAADEAALALPGEAVCCDYDSDVRRLRLSDALPSETQLFYAARQLALQSAAAELDAIVAEAGLSSPMAEALYRGDLAAYVVDALMMPYDSFRLEVRRLRHDLELLQHRFGVTFEQVCQRLATLQRPAGEGIPFHIIRVDIAGNVLKRFSASGLSLPRFGGACPRWNLHAAFLTPGQLCHQLVRLPEGATYIFLARAERRAALGFGKPAICVSTSIGCDASFAGQLVYADGLNLDHRGGALPVGINCRQCPHNDCEQRAYPAVTP